MLNNLYFEGGLLSRIGRAPLPLNFAIVQALNVNKNKKIIIAVKKIVASPRFMAFTLLFVKLLFNEQTYLRN